MLTTCDRCGTSLDRADAARCGGCDYTVCPSCLLAIGSICQRCGNLVALHIHVPVEEIDVVPARRVDAVLDATFGSALRADGFVEIRHRVWARARVPEITDVFNIQALKGASLSPRWGFSVAFVPHVASGKVTWHRTLKSARLDIRYDPVDYTGNKESADPLLHTLYGEAKLRDQAAVLAPLALTQAASFWGSVTAIADLPHVLQRLKDMDKKATRFGFYNYPTHPLSLAFVHARLGDRAAALDEFSRCLWFENDPPELKPALAATLEAELARRGA